MSPRPGLLLAVLMPLAAACGPGPGGPVIDFGDVEPESAAPRTEAEPVRIAVSAIASPAKSLRDYEAILRRVGELLDRPVEVVLRRTYAESNALLESRQVDAALVCSGPYVEAREKFGAEILAVPRIGHKTVYRAYVIVRKDGPIRGFDGLRGKTFAFTDPLSTSGYLFPAYVLAERGTTPDDFFGKAIFTHAHDNSVRAVAERLVDGAAVHELIWKALMRDEPEAASRTRVILESQPIGMQPVVVHPALDPELKEGLRRALLGLHEDETGRRLLERVGIERFVPQRDSAYDGVRRMRALALGRGDSS